MVGLALRLDGPAATTSVTGNFFLNNPGTGHIGVGVFDGDLDVGSIIGANTLDASGGRIGIFANDDAPQEITGTQFGDFMFDNSVGGQAQVFHGGGGNDVIMSGDGADTLDGGTGADAMTGGLGNDTYVVDNVGDVVTEALNEGTDTVQSSLSYTLGANVDNLTLTGSSNINGTGNGDANVITGNSGNNTLDGAGGADAMIGGLGNDTYVVDNVGDVVTEALNEGTDTVQSSVSFALGANVENLTLTGSANVNGTGNGDANVITGNSGNNILDGGVGADTAAYTGVLAQSALTFNGTQWVLNGGAEGTDTLSNIEIIEHGGGRYLLVDPTGHSGFATANEAAQHATRPGDTLVFATPPGGTVTIDLGGSDDNHDLTILGDDPVDITVGGGDNQITTGGGNNEIVTGDGNNEIVTGDGNNQIVTGGGDNVIVTGNGNNEIETGDGNNDITTGSGNDTVTTGSGDDTIHTGDGNDVVHAGGGNDAIVGGQGGGNDLYDGGSGSNTVEYPSAINGVTVDLNEIDRSGDPILGGALGAVLTGASLPVTTPVGYAQGADIGIDALIAIDNVVGSPGNDTIFGNSDANLFTGGGGDDRLAGRAGIDTALYAGTLLAANITAVIDADPATAGNQAGWRVIAGPEGTDLLTGIEKITDGTGHTFLLAGSGGFATLAQAQAAAQPGDEILTGVLGPVRDSFDGDSKSDILWQSNNGTVAAWLMDGTTATTVTAAGSFNPGPTWHVKGSGDFDGDGKADIIWQGDNGTAAMWLMDGPNTTFVGAVGPFNPGPTWHIEGTGDFNGDGKSDIIWQGDNGTAAMWLMDGTNTTFVGAVGPFNPGPAWHIKGTGDFNGDGKSDIIWQGDNGTAAMWLMDGTNATFVGAVGSNPGPTWEIKGTGDFNGDGKSDLVWQGKDGTAAVWLMDGTNVVSATAVGSNPGPTWEIKGTGDFNGDGKSDILWQGQNGTPAIWLMDGTDVVSVHAAGSFNPGSDWHVII